MGAPLACDDCRKKTPHVLSCIHTFARIERQQSLGEYDRDEEQRTARELVAQYREGDGNPYYGG